MNAVLVVSGAVGNFGLGLVGTPLLLLMYWWQQRGRPERRLPWGSLVGLILLSAFAVGLIHASFARFGPADELAYKPLLAAIAIYQALLLIAWSLRDFTPTFPTRVFVVFLVVWLVLGGGYLTIIMSTRAPLRDPFWFVATAPLLVLIAYMLVSITAKWLMGSSSRPKDTTDKTNGQL